MTHCSQCDLDLKAQDAGDGPAVFAILILGAVVMLGMVVVEFKLKPPVWVHLVLWPPLIVLGALCLLRILKAGFIALQHRHHRLNDGHP